MFVPPAIEVLSGSFSRADLFLLVFCLVDDWMKLTFASSNCPRTRRGPRRGEFTDAEVLTVLLVGELCHCRRERSWLRQVRASYGDLFPALPEDSRFSRRAQRVRELLRKFRGVVLWWADADLEPLRIFDSFPMPLCACYRIRQSTLPIASATFGRNPRKRMFYYGLRPGLLITASGFVVDLVLSPGNCNDTPLLAHYLDECVERGVSVSGQTWVMDKGFRNSQIAAWAQERLGLTLLARKKDTDEEAPSFWQATLDRVRHPVEGVLSVLSECFGIQHVLARSDWGVYRRTQAKATAYTLACYLNRILGRPISEVAHYGV